MGLEKIDQALTTVGVDFDFIGFDACLMATTETGLMLAEHADYMIASEESEPGTGWYYTNWLTNLSKNTSMATLDIGMNIVDDFVAYSKQKTPRQSATLSVVDLAELEATVPAALSAFSKSANGLLENKQFKKISTARGNAREFASDSRIDQVDLVDMAAQIDTPEAKALTDALLGAVKYNNASSDMTNSYGLSIYFPYRSLKYTNSVLNTYKAIDMSEDYSSVVRNFATYATSGQVSSGGNTNPYSSLSGQSYSNQSYQTQSSSDLVLDLLQLFLTGSSSVSSNQNYSSYYTPGFNFLFGRSIDPAPMAEYIAENHFDADLNWKDGKIHLTSKQWELVEDLKLAVFVDDGKGYIDLGTDNVFDISDTNDLLAPKDLTWLGLSTDGSHYETMPYFHVSTTGDQEDYTIIGRAPVLYNGEPANLLIVFTDEEPNGTVAGLTYDYDGLDLPTIGKRAYEFTEGDTIQFVTDYYDYEGNYDSSWTLGDPLTVTGNWYIGDLDLSDQKVLATYEFTDIYQQHYWTAPVK